MKTLALIVVSGLLAANSAHSLTLGAYKVVDVYCANPNYKFSQEEQDYIDTLTGKKGSCIDGKYTSPPCFEDYYVFSTPTSGLLVSKTTDLPGVSCVSTTEMTYTTSAPNKIDILIGKAQSRGSSDKPDVSLDCQSSDEGHHVYFDYKEENGNLLLMIPGPANAPANDCGTYIYKTAPVKDIPK